MRAIILILGPITLLVAAVATDWTTYHLRRLGTPPSPITEYIGLTAPLLVIASYALFRRVAKPLYSFVLAALLGLTPTMTVLAIFRANTTRVRVPHHLSDPEHSAIVNAVGGRLLHDTDSNGEPVIVVANEKALAIQQLVEQMKTK